MECTSLVLLVMMEPFSSSGFKSWSWSPLNPLHVRLSVVFLGLVEAAVKVRGFSLASEAQMRPY